MSKKTGGTTRARAYTHTFHAPSCDGMDSREMDDGRRATGDGRGPRKKNMINSKRAVEV